MAKVALNPVMEKIQGKIGDLVFKRYNDEVVVSPKPDLSGHEPTPAQAAHRERFRLAVLYGKTVIADPEKRALYEHTAKEKGIPLFAMTVGDFLHAPAVDEIDLSGYTGRAGERIRIRASDDFEVTGVEVGITDANGAALERGPAMAANGTWEYLTTTAVPVGQRISIEVTATDRPGHRGTRTQVRE
jgi:hypothetical protein